MIVSILVIFLILFLRYNLNQSYSEKKENNYCYVIYAILILLAGMRYVIPDSDVMGYMEYYNGMGDMNWSEISERWDGNYVMYYYMCKAFSYTHLPYQFWFGFLELLYISGFARLINKFSADKLFAIFIFFTIGLFGFSFYALKQVAAMAIIWHAFAFFYDKKYIHAAILSVVAFYCHKTSAFFMLSFALVLLKKIRLFYVIITSLVIIVLAAPGLVFSLLANSVDDEHYLIYLDKSSEATYTVLILYTLLFIAAIMGNKNKRLNKEDDNIVMGLALISVVVQLFSQISGTAFRLALYYTPFLLILLSNNVKNRNVRIGIIVFLTVFMLYSGRQFPYRFFWQ